MAMIHGWWLVCEKRIKCRWNFFVFFFLLPRNSSVRMMLFFLLHFPSQKVFFVGRPHECCADAGSQFRCSFAARSRNRFGWNEFWQNLKHSLRSRTWIPSIALCKSHITFGIFMIVLFVAFHFVRLIFDEFIHSNDDGAKHSKLFVQKRTNIDDTTLIFCSKYCCKLSTQWNRITK